MRGTFNLADALIVITLSCSSTLAKDSSEESQEVRRVEGRVLDHEGREVSGADVWLPVRYVDPNTTAHCRTDENGQFALEVPESWLSPTRSRNGSTVWAFKKGHAIATASAQLALFSRMSNHAVELQLGKATDTSFVVLDPDGKPLPDAMVEPVHFRSSMGYSLVPPEVVSRVAAKADRDGRARMPNIPREGFLNLKVISKQFGTQQQRLNDKTDAPAERSIALQPVGRVAGRVTSDDPKWSRGVRFYLTTNPRLPDADGTSGAAMIVTDDNGRFEVAALAAGDLRIEGGVKQDVPVRAILPEHQKITANKGNELEIRLVTGVVVHGHVRTKDLGTPIAGARVSIRYGLYRQGDDVVSDKDGRFSARVLPGKVYQQVIAMPPGYALAQVGSPWSEQFDVPDAVVFKLPVIELVTTIKVPGRLIDQEGRPVVGAELYGVKNGRRYGFSKTDKQGKFTMRLPNGLKMESYQSWFDDQPHNLGVKRETPLLLQANIPERKAP